MLSIFSRRKVRGPEIRNQRTANLGKRRLRGPTGLSLGTGLLALGHAETYQSTHFGGLDLAALAVRSVAGRVFFLKDRLKVNSPAVRCVTWQARMDSTDSATQDISVIRQETTTRVNEHG